MKHRYRLIGLALLVAAALYGIVMAAIYGITQYYKPAKDIADSKADVVITADKLYLAFEADETQANADYLNKVIEVTGPVAEVATSQSGEATVILRSADMPSGVFCTMLPSDADAVRGFREGRTVTLKGLCTGYQGMDMMPGDVVLTQCSVVK